jgi:hypothetical protein
VKRRGYKEMVVAFFVLGSAAIAAQSANDPLSGLPLGPGLKRMADPIQSYKYCGKSASVALYLATDFADFDHENAWYAHAMPHAVAFTAIGGVRTFITPDGTAAVETADTFISYFKFSPGLTPAEMKILGAAPASRACSAD